MVERLRLVLKNQIFWLAFKAAVFGLILYWFGVSGGFFPALVFVLVAFWLYFKPIFNSFLLLPSFFVLLFLSLWTILFLNYFTFNLPAVIFLSFLFFILLCLKNFIFVQRKGWHSFFIFSLLYISFLEFFSVDRSDLFFLKWLLFLVIIFVLFRELFKAVGVKLFSDRDGFSIISMVLTLVIGELMWFISWLPIGFLSSANLTILAALLLSDLSIHHFSGNLKTSVIFKEISLFIALVLFIFLTSRWQI